MEDPSNGLAATLAALYDTVLDERHWAEAIAHIAGMFGAPMVSMFDFDMRTFTPSNLRLLGHDATAEALYMKHFHRLDPGRFVGASAPVGEWLADEQMLDTSAPAHQEYVRDFALPNGIGRAAGFKVVGNEDGFTYFGILRRPGAPRFGDEGRTVFEALNPHLQ